MQEAAPPLHRGARSSPARVTLFQVISKTLQFFFFQVAYSTSPSLARRHDGPLDPTRPHGGPRPGPGRSARRGSSGSAGADT